jgi:NADPH:quinone reductase-like Zn-dependent oxidoreductase
VDRVFALEDIAEAHERLAARTGFGKIVLSL